LGGGGVLVPNEDAWAIAESVVGLMDDRERLGVLGRQARELIVRHCSPGEMVERTMVEYERLVAR
ncbi:MAG: hypothetical protein FWD53_08710, partial [Phycisphaerales bacterium]|nr:hypothetical protein [Phycisphaerales bacterium]